MKGFVKNNGSRDSQGSLAFKLETMTTVIQSKKWVSDCFNVNDKAGFFSSFFKTDAFQTYLKTMRKLCECYGQTEKTFRQDKQ